MGIRTGVRPQEGVHKRVFPSGGGLPLKRSPKSTFDAENDRFKSLEQNEKNWLNNMGVRSGLRPRQGVHYGIYRDPIRGWGPILQKTLAHQKMKKKWGIRQYMMF